MSLLKNQSPSAIAAMKWDTLSSGEKIEIALSILKKPFEERLKEDTSILFKFVEKIQFFRDFDADTIHECCQYLTFFQAKHNQVIFKQGDFGRTFYIILSGSVGVFRDEFVLDPQTEGFKEDFPTKLKLGSKLNVNFEDKEIKKSIVLLDAQSNPVNNNNQHHERRKRNSSHSTLLLDTIPTNRVPSLTEKRGFVEVSSLMPGTAFGERSLLGKGARKATIISKGETYFACLDKEHFDKVLKEKQKRNHNENIQFFHELQLFKVFSSHIIEQIYYRSIKKKFITNQVVHTEGEKSEYIYIIKSGEFKVTKAVEIVDDQEKLLLNRNSDNTYGLKKKTPQKVVDVAIYSKGEVFGEEDVLIGRHRDTSVYCYSSEGELYLLPKEDFKNLLCSDEGFKTCIQKQMDTKTHFHNERLKVATNLTNQNKHLLIHLDDSAQRIHTMPSDASINSIVNNKAFSKTKAFMSKVRKYAINGSKLEPLEDLKSSASQLPTDENVTSPKSSKSVTLKKLINPNMEGDSKIRQYKRAKGVLSMNKKIIENLFPEINKDKTTGINDASNTGSKHQNSNLDKSSDNRALSENPKSKSTKKLIIETPTTTKHRKTSSLALSLSNRKSLLSAKMSPTFMDSPMLGGSYRQSKLSQTHGSNFFTTMLPSPNFVYPIMRTGFSSEVPSPAKTPNLKPNASRTWGSTFMQNHDFNLDYEERESAASPKNVDTPSTMQHSHKYSKTFYGPINPLLKKNYKKELLNVQNFMQNKLTGRSAKE